MQSLFSDTYSPALISTWTDGSGDAEDIVLSGNTIKKADGGLLTINPSVAMDLSTMQTLQLDVWRTDETAELRLSLVHSDNTEHTVVLSEANGYPAPVVGSWTHFDISLSQLTGLSSTDNIVQAVLSSHGGSRHSGEEFTWTICI